MKDLDYYRNRDQKDYFRDIETAGEAAAVWWGLEIRNPRKPIYDNGPDKSEATLIAELLRWNRMIETAQKIEKEDPEAFIVFQGILAELLNGELDKLGDSANRLGLQIDVDYDLVPDGAGRFLTEAALEAGIDNHANLWLPKTSMKVKPSLVSVRPGSGQPVAEIWRPDR